jgi:hypothetical protein
MAAIKGRIRLSAHGGLLATSRPSGANLKKMMTVEQLFAAPKNVRKTEARLERAKLTMAAAREKAAEMPMARAKKSEVLMRPTVLQRHRLARRLSSAAEA